MSSTSTAVTPLTDPVRARRFAPRPVKGRSFRGTLLAAFAASGRRPLSTASRVGSSAIKALGLKQVDVLGFSIGGFVVQEITLQAPELVRRLVLVGAGPRGGQNMATLTPEAQQIFGATYKVPEEIWLKIHFTDSEAIRVVLVNGKN